MITIDGKGTKDIDDAIWVERSPSGWVVSVAIADVSKDIKKGSTLDKRAEEVVATRYFATGNSPMFPRRLSEQKLSLWPGEPKDVVVIKIELDSHLHVKEVSLSDLKPIVSQAKLSYEEIPTILQEDYNTATSVLIANAVLNARDLSLQLMQRRRSNGAFVVYDLNNGWVTTEEGFIKKVEKKEEVVGQIIIQELMILANTEVAKLAVEHDVPVVFRNHEARVAAPDREELMEQIQNAHAIPLENLDTLRQRTHMLLGRADYGASLRGHYGLNLPAYLHFTSPIRRFVDLVNHRQIKAHLRGDRLPYTKDDIRDICKHVNEVEEAERQSARDHFKGEHEKRVESWAVSARRIEGFNPKDFERLTKVQARSGEDPSPEYVAAYLRRLQEGRVPLLCQVVVLVEAPQTEAWRDLREATLLVMENAPQNAVSALLLASQGLGWPEVTYQLADRSGPSHAPVFTVHAYREGLGRFSAAASNRKLAQQLAALALLGAASLGLSAPEEGIEPSPGAEPLEPVKAAPEDPLRTPGKNPVAALQEHSQKGGGAPPLYDFEQVGPDHVPKITCTATYGKRTARATAGSKKEAKKQAAALMVEQLLAAEA